MKIQLDTTNDTVTILEDVDLLELVYFLNNTTPKRDWKIKGNTFRVPTEDKSSFRDFTNPLPVQPNPYVPKSPTYPYGTGNPILWCGEGITKGVKIGEGGIGTTTNIVNDYMKRNSLYLGRVDPIDENCGNDLDIDKTKV